jgi:hypothetical protein
MLKGVFSKSYRKNIHSQMKLRCELFVGLYGYYDFIWHLLHVYELEDD